MPPRRVLPFNLKCRAALKDLNFSIPILGTELLWHGPRRTSSHCQDRASLWATFIEGTSDC